MKRVFSLIISASILFTGCAVQKSHESQESATSATENAIDTYMAEETDEYVEMSFETCSEQDFYDELYAYLDGELDADSYSVEAISSIYFSKEYVEERIYNSLENNYFGYYLSDIEWSFEGDRYVFSPDGSGNTIVKEFEEYESIFDQVIRNVAIGTGVILVCATLSIATGAAGMTAVSIVLVSSAKSALYTSLGAAAFGGIISGVVTGYQTHDFSEAMQAFALGASEGYKSGAIIGAVTGAYAGAKEVQYLKNYVPTAREAELIALDAYPGEEQVSFLNGEIVPANTQGATRPDIIRTVDGHIEAIEVKNYNLEKNLDQLVGKLYKQVGSRTINLPEGSTQRIVLNVQGRGYTGDFLDDVVGYIQTELYDIYPDIPVDVQGMIA